MIAMEVSFGETIRGCKCYFRMKDLEAHLLRNNFKGMTAPKMAQRMRDLGGEPIRPNLLDHRRVNYIQNNLRLLVAQTRAIDVVPTWTNTDADIIAEARRQWWEWRGKGLDGLGGWKQDIDGAFGDFAALGEGYLRAGMVEADSYSASTVIHYHPLNVMFDPYAKYPDESNWVVFSTVYGRIEAEAKFKNFDYEKYLSRQYQKTGIQLEGVRILEYFCKCSHSSVL